MFCIQVDLLLPSLNLVSNHLEYIHREYRAVSFLCFSYDTKMEHHQFGVLPALPERIAQNKSKPFAPKGY